MQKKRHIRQMHCYKNSKLQLPSKMDASSHNQKKDNNNLKTKNNQNWQKIELYGSPITKELKKTHSSRPVREAETCSWVESTSGKTVAGGPSQEEYCGPGWSRLQLACKEQLVDTKRWWLADPAVSHLHADKRGGTKGEQNKLHNPRAPAQGNKTSNHWLKTPWGLRWQQEKLPASQESLLERTTGSRNVHKPTHMGISTRRAHFACG